MKTSTNHQPKTLTLFWKKSAIFLLLPFLGAGAAIAGDRLLSSGIASTEPAAAQTVSQLPKATVAQAPNRSSAILSTTDSNFVVNAVDRVGPAVVRIDSSRTVKTKVPAIFNDPFFRQFFGADMPTPPSTRVERGTGSGFVIRPDGLILTNAHVVDGVDTVTVKLTDGRELRGKVLGTDPLTDVAVVKVQAANLPAVRVGNSDQLKPGEWAIAIGNPSDWITRSLLELLVERAAEVPKSVFQISALALFRRMQPSTLETPAVPYLISGARSLG